METIIITIMDAFKTILVACKGKLLEWAVELILTSTFTFLCAVVVFVKRPTESTASPKLGSLSDRAKRIEATLHDAVQNRQIEDESVLLWLSELRSIQIEISDLEDEFQTRSQLRYTSLSALLSYTWHCWCVPSQVDEINKKYDSLFVDRKNHMFGMLGVARVVRTIPVHRESASLQVEGPSMFHGRFEEKQNLVELLLNPSNSPRNRNFRVISIIGSGGIGKTALAQSVFNDGHVTDHFDWCMWLSLSSNPDPIKTIQKIIIKITRKDCNLLNLDTLQTTLRDLVKGQNILLVLDGLWTEDPFFWETIWVPLSSAKPESKILVTSRNRVATQYIGASDSQSIMLTSLDDTSLWLVLKDAAFPRAGADFVVQENLKEIGDQIVTKCDGSPLAAKLLGKALCNSDDETQWIALLNDMPDRTEVVQNIIPSLKLSYELLPLHLKRCFAYCAIFPKNYEFDRDDLVKLWVSVGLILSERTNRNKVLEDIGRKQFTDLLKRSFFQTQPSVNNNNATKYIMPGAIHDLAQSVSKYECLRVEHSEVQHGKDKRASYALLVADCVRAKPVLNHIYERKLLHTLIVYSECCISVEYPSPSQLIKKLKFLRSLDLSNQKLKKLPGYIRNLIHLRYLNLRGSLFEQLPESICELLNLQTLELDKCPNLKRLPKKLSKLINIRHIGLGLNWEKWDGVDFDSMPPNLGTLTSLQSLSRFSVSEGDESRINELRDLNLRGELCISKLENVKNGNEAKEAKLDDKRHIDFLMLKGSEDKLGFNKNVLENLMPAKTIKSIYIESYKGSTFPGWIEDPLFNKLETIRLSKCRECNKLPQLGKLSQLRTLYIQGLDKVTNLNDLLCVSGGSVGFESLQELHISDMPELLHLPEELPNVIKISNCPKLGTGVSNIDPVVSRNNLSGAIHWIQNINYLHSLIWLILLHMAQRAVYWF